MNQIYFLPLFIRKIKQAKKKHIYIKDDILSSLQEFLDNSDKEKYLAEFGLYKIRIPIKQANIGKSGGYRVLVLFNKKDVYFPVSLYFKGDQGSLEKQEIKRDIIQAYLEIQEWKSH